MILFEIPALEEHGLNWAEGTKQNMVPLKVNCLTIKFYKTTNALCIQGQGELKAKNKFFDLPGRHERPNTRSELKKFKNDMNDGDKTSEMIMARVEGKR